MCIRDRIREAFEAFTARRGAGKLVCYVSDHGDQVGDRGIYGKDTFFEKSAKVPMILAGDGVQAGRAVNTPVSLLDLGPTLWDWLGTDRIPQTDGESLAPALRGEPLNADRPIISELLELLTGNKFDPKVMAAPKEYGFGVMVQMCIRDRGKALFGYEKILDGQVLVGPEQVVVRDPETAIKHGMAYTSKDRDHESVGLAGTIRDNIASTGYIKNLLVGPIISGSGRQSAFPHTVFPC